ncbi:hypothetical protein [Adlercreutzia sp. ZJ154]|uniref:coiled-coil domain-containing protein n=1 Tax=Adlercreutzia sp. ZJ154 TaxID=2709790 RepID=UPI0013EBC1A9|nr:hypothetical protein [Adlercreutzia sp. ZJ154]
MTFAKKSMCILIAVAFAFSASVAPAPIAFADEDPNAVLDAAQAKLDEISNEYNELSSEVNALQSQIDELADQVLAAQQEMIEGRKALGTTVLYEYRGGSVSALLNVLMGSSDISELTRNMNYISQIMDHQAEEIEVQKDLKERFTKISNELTVQKDEQNLKLEELATKREEATKVVEEASARVEENNARIEQMRKQADQFIWGGVQEDNKAPQADVPEQNTLSNEEKTETQPNNNNNNNNANTQTAPSDVANYRTVVSSAYGGWSDKNTPNPGTTANGSICDDNSMGIAIPMSWSNRGKYYGRTAEIVWNGRVVYATVNDCGNMDKYGCEIDLQPGVWKALDPNCTTCAQWGHRKVKYRIL